LRNSSARKKKQASQQSLKAIQKAFHEAMLALPREEYDWFDVQGRARQDGGAAMPPPEAFPPAPTGTKSYRRGELGPSESPQRQFFDYAGPLFGVVVSPLPAPHAQ